MDARRNGGCEAIGKSFSLKCVRRQKLTRDAGVVTTLQNDHIETRVLSRIGRAGSHRSTISNH
jgi:hypothetical protein